MLGLFISTAAGQSSPLPIETFWQQLADTYAWVQTNPAPETWEAQAKQWSAIQEVLLPDGSVVPVNTREMVQLLRAAPPDRGRLSEHLSTLLQARERWSKIGDGAGELAALQKILARPEFQNQSENFLQRLYRQALDFLSRLLDKLFPDTGLGSVPLPPELVIPFSVLLLGGILAFVFRNIWRDILPETELQDENPADAEILSASQASQRARHLSSNGDYRQAVRYLYLSALLLLDERGLLRYNRTLTNREYLRQLSGQPELASLLRPVIETFDEVWYGFQPVDEASYAQYTGQVAALEETRR